MFNPSFQKPEAGQPSLQLEFQKRQGYAEKFSLKNKNNTHTHTHTHTHKHIKQKQKNKNKNKKNTKTQKAKQTKKQAT